MSNLDSPGIIDRTLLNLRSAWRGMSTLTARGRPELRPDLPDADVEALRKQMRECLEGVGGDVSARSRAAALGESYFDLNDAGRLRYLKVLAEDFGVDRSRVRELAAQYAALPADGDPSSLQNELTIALRAERVELLTQFNSLPSGVKFLVDLRADLRRLSRGEKNAALKSLDNDLKELLRSWFDVGFLDLETLSWNTPAAVLEKLIDYEAVHAIRSWSDLKNRLQSDRRVFAFFHPRMPDEPLIFVEVALVKNIADNIQTLLDESQPLMSQTEADTAIFYSITSAQVGLAGVGLGEFLIKRVVDKLKLELPNIKTFCTLSPIPGLRRYLDGLDEDALLTDAEREKLAQTPGYLGFSQTLDSYDWHQDEALADALKPVLMRHTARYLIEEKRRNRAMDSVANFHLNNGARLERVNWLGDTSVKGMQESAGIMVNYLYKLNEIEQNHETYRASSATIASAPVKALLK